jgi:hypothetical protein
MKMPLQVESLEAHSNNGDHVLVHRLLKEKCSETIAMTRRLKAYYAFSNQTIVTII